MKQEDAEEFTQGLGQVVGGSYKIIAAAQKMGVPKALGLTTSDWVNQHLGGYVKMTIDDRREIVEELADDGMSQRQIAEVVGVDVATVNRDVANATPEIEESSNDGGSTNATVANATPLDLVSTLAADASIREEADKQLKTEHNHRAQGTGENEWYTPQKYLDAALRAMGSFSLDPASSVTANERVKADKYFDAEHNGLEQDWWGNVWLNPPYSKELLLPFIEKLVHEYSAGRVKQAICLTHNYTDTRWFHTAESVSSAICFTRGRVAFLTPDGETCSPTQGQAFFYFGADARKFTMAFKEIGFVR